MHSYIMVTIIFPGINTVLYCIFTKFCSFENVLGEHVNDL